MPTNRPDTPEEIQRELEELGAEVLRREAEERKAEEENNSTGEYDDESSEQEEPHGA